MFTHNAPTPVLAQHVARFAAQAWLLSVGWELMHGATLLSAASAAHAGLRTAYARL